MGATDTGITISLGVSYLSRGVQKVTTAFSVLFFAAVSVAQSRSWDDLRSLRLKYSLPVYEIGGQCHIGYLKEVTPTKLVITWSERTNGQQVSHDDEVGRSDILAVGAGHDLVYSGRSSWRDVQEAKPGYGEHLHVTVNGGREITGTVIAISENELRLSVIGREHIFAKSQIKTIDYVRQRPLSDGSEHIAEEAPGLLLFSPDTWARATGISPKLHVRIYDASLPENDKELLCQPEQRLGNLAK